MLYTANPNFATTVDYMQRDIDSIAVWCTSNGIMANSDKTKIMLFGSSHTLADVPLHEVKFGDFPLQSVCSYKYLGVTLDSQLNFNLHINKIIASMSGKLKQFQRMRSFLNTRAALLVYKTMLLPILEYGDIFLSAAKLKNRKKLRVLQNKGLRCALNKGIESNTAGMHSEAKLLKLRFRREQHLLNFMFDKAHHSGNLEIKAEAAAVTRSQKKKIMKLKKPKTEKFKKSLAYKGPTCWNSLPLEMHMAEDKLSYKRLVGSWVDKKALKLSKINV